MIVTLEKISKKVKEKTGVDVVNAKGRKRHVVDAKRLFGHLAKIHTDLKLYEIAEFIKKDHAMIIYYCNTSDNLIRTNKDYKELFEDCSDDLEYSEYSLKKLRSYHLKKARLYQIKLERLILRNQ